jgi:hypothetical protein
LTHEWRFDRMATVCHPESGRISTSFAAVAKHYGVSVKICPARRGNRKGVVEKANHVAAQRWWRTLADEASVETAQASLDRWCSLRGDTRIRPTADGRSSVATIAAAEPLAPIPTPFPAVLRVERTVSAQALVSFRGNRYSVPPELARAQAHVIHRLGNAEIDIATAGGIVLARHHLATPGAGATIRDTGHVLALEAAALAAFTDARPHRRKQRIPPGPAARAAAAALRGHASASEHAQEVVIDLAAYAAAAEGRNTLR